MKTSLNLRNCEKPAIISAIISEVRHIAGMQSTRYCDILIDLLAQEDELAAGEECKRDSE
jgi:hypothetical protein